MAPGAMKITLLGLFLSVIAARRVGNQATLERGEEVLQSVKDDPPARFDRHHKTRPAEGRAPRPVHGLVHEEDIEEFVLRSQAAKTHEAGFVAAVLGSKNRRVLIAAGVMSLGVLLTSVVAGCFVQRAKFAESEWRAKAEHATKALVVATEQEKKARELRQECETAEAEARHKLHLMEKACKVAKQVSKDIMDKKVRELQQDVEEAENKAHAAKQAVEQLKAQRARDVDELEKAKELAQEAKKKRYLPAVAAQAGKLFCAKKPQEESDELGASKGVNGANSIVLVVVPMCIVAVAVCGLVAYALHTAAPAVPIAH